MFFNKTNMSARDNVPSFEDISKLCGRGCSCPPRAVLDRAFCEGRPRRFCQFCHSGVLYLSTRPGVARCGLTRLRGTKGLGNIIARGVSKLRRGTNDGGIVRLRNDILEGCYREYLRFMDTRRVLGSANIPGYPGYNNPMGPSIMLCRRNLGRGALRSTVCYVDRTSILVMNNASLTMCPTTNLVSCCGKGGLILVGGSAAPVSTETSLLVRRKLNSMFRRVRIWARSGARRVG